MPAEQKIIKRLEKCGAPYEIRDVERDFEGSSQDASALMHVDIRQIAKTLVYKVPFGAAAIIACSVPPFSSLFFMFLFRFACCFSASL